MDLSLVMPAYNNPEWLSLALASIARQDCGGCRFEVLVVDDGSVPPLDGVARAAGPEGRVRYLRQGHAGRAAARNRGAAAARGDVLAFADSDVIAAPGFIAGHWRGHAGGGDPRVGIGRIKHIPTEHFAAVLRAAGGAAPPRVTDLEALVREDMYLRLAESVFADELAARTVAWACCLFGNLSMPRHIFARAGGFDEDFRGWGLEDIEFGYRIHRAGFGFKYFADCVDYHVDHRADPAAMLCQMSGNLKRFVTRHPHPEVRAYATFVAGFCTLSQFVAAAAGPGHHPAPGRGDLRFRPIAYSKSKA